ncbi:hypothetical protein, partial [Leptospira santarosai]|uniref:hypothetical protein n=2 Tax=Leptospira santarosai TaxID=28183 RepID=UPI0024AF063F
KVRLDHLLFKENQRLLGATTKTRGFRKKVPRVFFSDAKANAYASLKFLAISFSMDHEIGHATFSVFEVSMMKACEKLRAFLVSARIYDSVVLLVNPFFLDL